MKLVFSAPEGDWVQRWQGQFELIEEPYSAAADEFYLFCDRGELVLYRGDDRRGIRIPVVEFASRRKGKFALGQAIGPPAADRLVFDATVGLGGDLLALHSRGYRVAGYERHPVLWAMLDSHLRVQGIEDLTLTLDDSLSAMTEQRLAPAQVIYLDPMFPDERKAALPGKAMQYLRALLPPATADAAELVAAACALATDRVVLKRRRRDPIIADPSWQIKGSTIRFDVYSARGG
jgi:hypothetical protein